MRESRGGKLLLTWEICEPCWTAHEEGLSNRAIGRLLGIADTSVGRRIAWAKEHRKQQTLERKEAAAIQKQQKVARSANEPSPQTVVLQNRNYEFNEMTGAYIFAVTGVTKPVVLSKATVEAMLRAYSKDGEGSTINQMCRTFNLRRNIIVSVMRALGHTHDSLPFTAEEMAARADEELSEEVRQLRQGQVYSRIEKEKWDDIKGDAHKWRRFQHTVLEELMSVIQEPASSVPALRLTKAASPYAAVITPTDFHFGKYSDLWECGADGNRTVSRANLLESTSKVLSRLQAFGRPEKIIIGVGSDWFNSDNEQGTTTQGTPQDNDGNPMEIVRDGTRLMYEYVDILRQVAPVHLIGMAGNHDRTAGFALLLCLEARYMDYPDVTVDVSSGSTRQYLQYGDTMAMFCHSDYVVKPKELALLAATEQPKMWGGTQQRVCFTGDKHHELVRDASGFLCYQLPSLSPEDRWHARSGYVGTRRALAGVLIERQGGVFATLYG